MKIGDLVRFKIPHAPDGIVVGLREEKAKDIVGRAGFIEMVTIMFSNGKIGHYPLTLDYELEVLNETR